MHAIKKFFRRLYRHLKEGVVGVFRHGAMSISSISAVTITLCIVGIFTIFFTNVESMKTAVEGTLQIAAKVNTEYESSEQITKIRSQIESIEGVSEITFYTKDEELQFYIDQTITDEEQRSIFIPYEEEGNNPFHHMFYINIEDGLLIDDVAEKVSNIEGIQNVSYGGSSAVLLISALNKAIYGGGLLILALSLLALFLVANTIKLTIYAREQEISIMRNVGASNNNIRVPFVIEGALIGLIGSIIPVIAMCQGYNYLYNFLGGIWFSNLFPMIQPLPLMGYVSLFLVCAGVLVGLLGSLFSVSRYLRLRR